MTQDIPKAEVAGRVIWGDPAVLFALFSSAAGWRQAVERGGSLVSPDLTVIALSCPLLKKYPMAISSALRTLDITEVRSY